ncbi:type VI secretion system protein [Gemmatimonadetes bacterium T265]|nr:type VI secretion system protein [Gemmatimonadetes bacterium T265]
MREDLVDYYEQELRFLRRMGATFAERYPKVAARLQLEPTKCEDPHVERLLEGFALLAARVHLKLDDDFPEVSEALLGVVYPHHLRPLPACSVVQFQLDPEQGRLTTGLRVPRGSVLHSPPVQGTRCAFRTCYDTTVWPVTVAAAQWVAPEALRPAVRAGEAVGALRLELRCAPGLTFAALDLSALRLYLHGEGGLPATLYELLCRSCTRVLVREPGGGRVVELSPSVVRPVGFEEDERLLPYPGQSLAAYGLLQDYFALPQKYQFLDLAAFDAVRAAGFGEAVEVVFLVGAFERPERRQALATAVDERVVQLGCAPVVNLFAQTSEPILLTQKREAYPLVPDARRRLTVDVFSVDAVTAVTPGEGEPVRVEPLYAHRHGGDQSRARVYWYARRRAADWRPDGGTEVTLSFVDPAGRLARPDRDAATAHLTCHNGSLPSRLPLGGTAGDLTLQGGGPLRRVTALVQPTDVVHPPLGKPLLWRLVSQLSLNYLSLADGDPAPLRELLRLHVVRDEPAAERQIAGVVGVRGSPVYARVASDYGLGFARGRRIDLELDEEQFAGGGAYLFASVLERFLALYASLNSFTALTARTRQRVAPLGEWAPRAGCRVLV